MFNPEPEYQTKQKITHIRDFHAYADEYVVRPPYQRKNVWPKKKQQALLDSLIRRYYIPRLIIRQVRLGDNEVKYEVVDGQQRIYTVQLFFEDQLVLPASLADVSTDLPGQRYSQLSVDMKKFIDKELVYEIDQIMGLEDPHNPEHQRVATEIFWRLQQGESLNYMEVAHSRLASTARNFVVKYADDISFDFDQYKPLDYNPHKHAFFTLYNRNNNRMQHLALLTRLLMVEFADGFTDHKESDVTEFIDRFQQEDGIGNYSFEDKPEAKRLCSYLNEFYAIFKKDPMVQNGEPVRELQREYFVLSFVLLLRHLCKYYAIEEQHHEAFRDFVYEFYQKWANSANEDAEVLLFRDNRQQSQSDVEIRDRVLRELFFRYLDEHDVPIRVKDEQRTFNEAQRIYIYRRDRGLCQMCLEEGKSEQEARVPWSQYEADHVLPHSKGGGTGVENAQVLCSYHNKIKGAHVPSRS